MKIHIKEDNYNDRINDTSPTMTQSIKTGDFFFRASDYLYNELTLADTDINLEAIALSDGYDNGIVSRTELNNFNKELDDITKSCYELSKKLHTLREFSLNHLGKERYNELQKYVAWFKKQRS